MIDDATTDRARGCRRAITSRRCAAIWLDAISIRVNSQWRLIFRWDGSRGGAAGVWLDDHGYR